MIDKLQARPTRWFQKIYELRKIRASGEIQKKKQRFSDTGGRIYDLSRLWLVSCLSEVTLCTKIFNTSGSIGLAI